MQKFVQIFSLAVCLFLSFGAKAQNVTTGPVSAPVVLEEDPPVEGEEEEEEEAKFTLSGSADAYFRASTDDQAPVTSFANLPGFSLGMFNLIGTHEGKKAGFVGDLVFGPRGGDAVFASGVPTIGGVAANASTFVNQLYVYFNASDNVTLTLGNFNTFLGYEVISPAGNFNYSTSYMFSYGPFSHTGIKADIGLGEDVSLMLGVFNPTDLTEANYIGSYSYGAQLGYKGVYLNLLYGDQDGDAEGSAGALFQVDLTAGFDVTEDLYVGVNATMNSYEASDDTDRPGFYGFAGYCQYALSESFALGLRGEYFGENNTGYGIIGAYDTDLSASVIDLTLSGNITIGDLTLIPEIRLDAASEDVFLDGDGKATSSLASFVLAGVYAF
ncbi:outer membrane beta-barrel protein [Lewinella cohaerens]|uniref:outer membrane beta-barrel protein n=1 Tax=Lewinella cohaerens TaxID=70995 RepID=UPI00037ACDD4|nr:outer membrane beta-barrel protein [Lewinella cohaerens]